MIADWLRLVVLYKGEVGYRVGKILNRVATREIFENSNSQFVQ